MVWPWTSHFPWLDKLFLISKVRGSDHTISKISSSSGQLCSIILLKNTMSQAMNLCLACHSLLLPWYPSVCSPHLCLCRNFSFYFPRCRDVTWALLKERCHWRNSGEGKRPFLAARDGLQNKEIFIHPHILLLYAHHVQTQVAGVPK